MFYAERYQTEFDNNQEMLVPRSVAASYLCKNFIFHLKLLLLLFSSWYTISTISKPIIQFTH